MKISCPACQAKYSIADEKVNDRLAKIRCRKCGATIVIDGKVSPANVYAAAGEAPDVSTGSAVEQDANSPSYSVDFGEGDQRNMTVGEIVAAYNSGQVNVETYLWADGFADWKALGEVDEVVDALHSATNALSAPAPAPAALRSAPKQSATATPSPWAAPAAAASRAAARPARAAADLFGGIDQAGSEDEVMTSAPEHGGGQAAPPPGAGSSTGARNESSVLFSLSALTSASSPMAAQRPSSRPISGTSRDDSGLIDLKALTAAATKNEAALALSSPLVGASPLGIASPLGVASPLGGGFAASAQPGPTTAGGKSKTGLYIGVGVVLAAAIVGAAIILKPAPPPPPVALAPAPVPAAPPTPAAVITATPPATGVAEEPAPSAKVAAPVVQHKVGGGASYVAKKPPAGSGDAPTAAPAAKPAVKRGSCGCAPGDLTCAIVCSTK